MASKNNLNSIKIILVGSSGAGKSSIVHRFIDEVFNEEQTQTVGVEFGAKVVTVNGKRVKIMLWDTAGQERYKSVSRSYYRGAAGAIIVYDITSKESYQDVPQWLQDVRQLCGPEVTVMLIGNKTDLVVGNPERRQVAHTEASVFAQENNIMHMETSAASGEFVPEAFLKVAKATLARLEQRTAAGNGNSSHGSNSARGGKGLLQHSSSAGVRVVDDEEDEHNSPHGTSGGSSRKVRLGNGGGEGDESDLASPQTEQTRGGEGVCSRC